LHVLWKIGLYIKDELRHIGGMKQLTTIDEVIAELGGPTEVAKLVGAKWSSSVYNWKSQGLPSKTFLVLQAALAEAGCTAPPSLWSMPQPVGWHLHAAPIEVCLVKSGAAA
jgi:hypothetical protein